MAVLKSYRKYEDKRTEALATNQVLRYARYDKWIKENDAEAVQARMRVESLAQDYHVESEKAQEVVLAALRQELFILLATEAGTQTAVQNLASISTKISEFVALYSGLG